MTRIRKRIRRKMRRFIGLLFIIGVVIAVCYACYQASLPVISLKEGYETTVNVEFGKTVNVLDGVTATDKEDGDLTSNIFYSGKVDFNTPGSYTIIYNVSDSDGNEVTFERTFIVLPKKTDSKPVILLDGTTIDVLIGTEVDLLEGVSSSDEEDGDLTNSITYIGTVDVNTVGKYYITYSVTDLDGNTVSVTRTYNVYSDEFSGFPVIHVSSTTINVELGKPVDLLDGITASDAEDGDLTDIIQYLGTVDFNKAGSYVITYSVTDSDDNEVTIEITYVVIGSAKADELSIHFLEVGNKYTGDAVYIKAGDNDILIDAGSRNASAGTIASYINQYVTDGKLEYVIATHAHQDHIAGFVGTSSVPGIFDRYEVGTIIDFARTNATSQVYKNYVSEREEEIASGAKHYTALECWNNENGAQRTYVLGEGITMNILYNYYYDHNSSDENEYSVCILISHNDRHFLFTGDLESKGEGYLVQYNQLPEVDVFKAGHHGSYTASTEALLKVIKPKNIVVCCCCGSNEYTSNNANTFPAQDFINRAFKYTKNVYVTTIADGNSYKSMNGNVVVTSNDSFSIHGTNNDILLIDTEWFKNNRTWVE